MSDVWLGFACGMFLGAPAGMVVMALCVIAKQADRDISEMFEGTAPGDRPLNTVPTGLPRNR